jgi:hypothetical protein
VVVCAGVGVGTVAADGAEMAVVFAVSGSFLIMGGWLGAAMGLEGGLSACGPDWGGLAGLGTCCGFGPCDPC